jgi:O-antigen ligase
MKTYSRDLKLYAAAFALFLGTGPIYWAPIVGAKSIGLMKAALYGASMLWPLLYVKPSARFNFPGGEKVFFLLMIFFGFSLPGILQGKSDEAIYRLQNNFQILSLVVLTGILMSRQKVEIVVGLAVKIFAAFCCISLLLMFVIPDYPSPLNEELSFSQTGFGGSRTSWSPAIALYLPWLYAWVAVPGIITWFGLIGMVGNQVMVAGRTGLVAAIIPFLVYGISRRSYKSVFFTIIILGGAYLFAINNLELLRLDSGGFKSAQDLSELSSGRTDQYSLGFDAIRKSPIVGMGFGQVTFGEANMYIHNVILRFAAECGIPSALSILGIFWIGLIRGWRGVLDKNSFVTSAFLTLLSGVIGSFFEPFAMFGSFYSSALWWVSFAICVAYKRKAISLKPIGVVPCSQKG